MKTPLSLLIVLGSWMTVPAADGPKVVHTLRTDAHVKWVAITPDGKSLLAGGQVGGVDGSEVRAWDLGTGKQTAGLVTAKIGDPASGAISPDGKHLLAGDTLGRWQLRALPDLKLVGEGRAGTGRVHRVAFAPDGKTFAVLHASYRKRLSDPIKEGRVTYTVRTYETDTREPVGAASSWPRERLAGEAAHLPRMREPAGWTEYGRPEFGKDGRALPPVDAACETLALPEEQESCGGAMATAIALDHKRAISAGCNGEVLVWDYPARKVDGKPLAVFPRLSIFNGGLSISPDGRRAAVVVAPFLANERPEVTVFDLDRRTVVAGPFRPTAIASTLVEGLAFSPDGSTLVIAGNPRDDKTGQLNGRIEVWALAGGK